MRLAHVMECGPGEISQSPLSSQRESMGSNFYSYALLGFAELSFSSSFASEPRRSGIGNRELGNRYEEIRE